MAGEKESSARGWRALRLEALIAATFLTRVPLPFPRAERFPTLAESMRWFPLVGAGVGLASGGVMIACARLGLGPIPAGVATVAATLLLTGGLHEDGLADCADGFGGGRDRAAKLAILRDSRIGSYGALALAISVLLRASLIAEGATIGALVAAHALSRAALPAILRWLPLARDDGLAPRSGRPGRAGTAAALFIGAGIAALALGPARGVIALAAAAAGGWAVGAIARRHIGGVTGDVLGAAQQVIEILALAVAVARPVAW